MTEKIASLELLGEGLFLFRDKIYSKETQNVVITMWLKGKSYIDKFPTPSRVLRVFCGICIYNALVLRECARYFHLPLHIHALLFSILL